VGAVELVVRVGGVRRSEEERGGLVDTYCHLHLLDEEAEELVATARRAGLALRL
jgi:protoporphyrinogen oxidase